MTDYGAPQDVTAQAAVAGLQTERLAQTIDRDTYSPALLGLLNNALVWGGSRVFQRRHGIGTNEWRILSALGNHPGASARDVCDVLGMNKSIASKSVNALLERGLLAQLEGRRGSRHLYLTDAGARVHDDLLPVARERERILQSGLSTEEIAQLNALLVRMLASTSALQEYEARMIDGDDPEPLT